MNPEEEEEEEDDDEEEELLIALLLLCEEDEVIKRGGSAPGKSANLVRDFDGAYERICKDYFGENPLYPEKIFERRFRMSRNLFLRITSAIREQNPYFTRRFDAVQKLGAYGLQKFVAVVRVLAYGIPADLMDEYAQISETVIIESIIQFARSVKVIFGSEYLRTPTTEDLKRIFLMNEKRGFPGMFGSVDCRHWEWKNCPTGWHGQYRGKEKRPTVVTEVVATGDLWIWHHFFGEPGTENDINTLDHSSLLRKVLDVTFPRLAYTMNGQIKKEPYFLADGIYPNWRCFAKPITNPPNEVKKHYTTCQEAVRKDAERIFGVLISRFKFLEIPLRSWDLSITSEIVDCLVILNNMIVEERREHYKEQPYTWENICDDDIIEDLVRLSQVEEINLDIPPAGTFSRFCQDYVNLTDFYEHCRLQNDLAQHLWSLK
jgi:hypothetical protein